MHQWDPAQYEKFEKERNQPFYDLLQLIHPIRHPRIVDLGCGNGSLTSFLHAQFHASYTLGIDASKEMLSKASHLQTPTLKFEECDIQTIAFDQPFDLIISNAALQWIPNHAKLMEQLTSFLVPEGQLAIQMPVNQSFATHVIAEELAREEPFKQMFSNQDAPFHHMLQMEEYAQLFESLGFENQIIRLQLYSHYLESTASVIEWVKGSLLTYYKAKLGPSLYPQFFNEYQKRVLQKLGWSEPFFFPMKRLLMWAQLPAH